jgi:hypothetical protein
MASYRIDYVRNRFYLFDYVTTSALLTVLSSCGLFASNQEFTHLLTIQSCMEVIQCAYSIDNGSSFSSVALIRYSILPETLQQILHYIITTCTELLEKVMVSETVKESLASYGSRGFITMFMTASHFNPVCTITPRFLKSLSILSSHIRQNGIFTYWGLRQKNMHKLLIAFVRATCFAQPRSPWFDHPNNICWGI